MITRFVERRINRRPAWLAAIPVTLGVVAAGVVGASQTGGSPDRMRELDKAQNVDLLKRYYPDDYDRLARRITALPASADNAQAATVVDTVLGEVVDRQRPHADNAISREMLDVARTEAVALRSASARACSAFMDGAGRSEDLEKVMTPDLRARDLAAARRMLVQTASAPEPRAIPMSVETLFALSRPALEAMAEADQDLVITVLREGRMSETPEEHRVMCDFYIAQAAQILSGPPDVVGARVRAFWAMN